MVQDREGYILYLENYSLHTIIRIHAKKSLLLLIMLIFTVMRLLALGIQLILKCLRKRLLMLQMNIAFLFKTFDASYVLTNKSGKVVAKYVGGKHKSPKTCVWVPKVLVCNVKAIWVPKDKA
jgi:hypothetical protein